MDASIESQILNPVNHLKSSTTANYYAEKLKDLIAKMKNGWMPEIQ
jgi:hypothetical protein